MLERPAAGWEPLILASAATLTEETGASPPWVGPVARYLDELLTWNRRMDLTAARTAEELVDLTVADAAMLARQSADEGAWIDVGSGAGAPGLIVAMMLPGVRMTLVEPRERRVAFLRSAIGKFGLLRTTVERGRSERLPARGWDTAVSRATLPPAEWLAEGARLASHGVWVLLARDEPPVLAGYTPNADVRYEWRLTGVPRRAVRYAPL